MGFWAVWPELTPFPASFWTQAVIDAGVPFERITYWTPDIGRDDV